MELTYKSEDEQAINSPFTIFKGNSQEYLPDWKYMTCNELCDQIIDIYENPSTFEYVQRVFDNDSFFTVHDWSSPVINPYYSELMHRRNS